jgi:hypothetical protein
MHIGCIVRFDREGLGAGDGEMSGRHITIFCRWLWLIISWFDCVFVFDIKCPL